tara:strand:+ start:3267 stop:4598 length:1332 start_codon:yes stop_codon:yes gene_type:complete
MIFSSIEFIAFFLIFIFLLKIFTNSQRELIILSSLVFYSYWNPIFIFLILYLCIITYYFIKNNSSLKLAIPLVLIPLFYFKYSSFLFSLLKINFLNGLGYTGNLPLAISFVTFTAIAILIDVKKRIFSDEINIKNLTEFLTYFPQLIAGPILRAKELYPSLKKKITFSNENIKFGIFLFTIGFVKKLFFADTIALVVDPIFEDPTSMNPKDLLKGYLLFPLQIYFDFSGYVDMALGASIILGISLPINFNKPYLTYSITEFWRNWHITLSNWFRDYLYIPLGGSKHGKFKLYFNLILTMSVAGLWHGANFNFILWGFLNGLFLCLEKSFTAFTKSKSILRLTLNCFLIFNLWIVFRITEITDLFSYFVLLYKNLFEIFDLQNIAILLFLALSIYSQKYENHDNIKNISNKLSYTVLLPIFIIILVTGLGISAGQSEKFIYFDF